MTAPIAGFIGLFQNLGLNQALVQARTLSDEQTNALFFINILASALIALALLLAAPLVGIFYADARAGYVMAASAASVLVSGSTLQHTALLTRQMRYKVLSAVDVSSAVAAFSATLVLALWLRNYWAIWLGAFAGTVVNAVFVWVADSWRPTARVQWRSARSLLRFGANLTGFNLLNYLSRNLDNVLIAKAWGPASLGLYDRSYRLMTFPLQSINAPLGRIMLPILARVQDEPDRYRRIYGLTIRSIALGSMPGVIAATICSDRLVPFLLGERWAAASPIFFWLSLAAVTQPISNASGWLFISSGRTAEMFRWSMLSTPVTIASFLAGLPWGPSGVAAAYFVGQALLLPILYFWCTRNSPVPARDLYAALLPSLVGGILAWGLVELVRERLPTPALLAVALVASYTFAVGVQALTPGGRLTLATGARLLQQSFFKR